MLTNYDEVDADFFGAEPVGALAHVDAGVILVDLGDLEALLGGPVAVPGVVGDGLTVLAPVDHGGGVPT